jgi:hypothetical protein
VHGGGKARVWPMTPFRQIVLLRLRPKSRLSPPKGVTMLERDLVVASFPGLCALLTKYKVAAR